MIAVDSCKELFVASLKRWRSETPSLIYEYYVFMFSSKHGTNFYPTRRKTMTDDTPEKQPPDKKNSMDHLSSMSPCHTPEKNRKIHRIQDLMCLRHRFPCHKQPCGTSLCLENSHPKPSKPSIHRPPADPPHHTWSCDFSIIQGV